MTSSESVLAWDDNAFTNRIVAHSRAQHGQVRSLRCEAVGMAMIPKGRYNGVFTLPSAMLKKDVPEKDYRYKIRLSWTIDFENNRMRKEYSGQTFHADKGKFVSEEWIHIFDGSTTKRYYPPEMNKDKGSEDADLGVVNHGNTVETGSYDAPVFFCARLHPFCKACY